MASKYGNYLAISSASLKIVFVYRKEEKPLLEETDAFSLVENGTNQNRQKGNLLWTDPIYAAQMLV